MPDIDQKHKPALSDHYHKGVEAARNNVPRWKRPDYYDRKHQDAWDKGYDDELAGARPPNEVRSNMPEPTAPADVVAAQATALLNDDKVKIADFATTEDAFTIRGVTLRWDKDVALRVMHPGSGPTTLGYSYVSPIFREVFFEAARGWHRRRRDERCAPLVKAIANSEPLPEPSPEPPPRRNWLQRLLGLEAR